MLVLCAAGQLACLFRDDPPRLGCAGDAAACTATDPTSDGGATLGETTTLEGTSGDTGPTTGSGGPSPDGGELYPLDVVHSPITPGVAAAMLAIAAEGPDMSDGVFAKIGGKTTESSNFMNCFAEPAAIVGLDPTLMATVDYFNTLPAGVGATSFDRVSLAANNGMHATAAGEFVLAELAEISPRFAVVLLGTHELVSEQPDTLFAFAGGLLAIVDSLTEAGTIPILTTLPTRTSPFEAKSEVPRYNAVIRAVAQGRRVPLIDLNLALSHLTYWGLAADGFDLDVYADENMALRPCDFGPAGLDYGYNVRNFVTLEALERARQVVVEGAPAPDGAKLLEGTGTLEQPFVIPWLPFSDLRSTADSPSDAIDAYAGGCEAFDESGPEYVYALTVADKTTIRAMVFDRAGTDVDLHLMTLQDIKTCVRRDDRLLTGPVEAGTYYLAVDTLGAATPGEFIFVVTAD